MKYFSYLIFRTFVGCFKLIPFRMVYQLSNFVSFLLCKVIKYRKNLVVSNIEKVFPNFQEKEKSDLLKKSYSNLADILLEGIKGVSMNRKQLINRYKYINPEIIDDCFQKNKSIILATGHYNNWEWAALSTPYFFKHQIVGIYKKLSNTYIDKYFKKSRSNTGIILYELNETSEGFKKQSNEHKPSLFLMAGDQSPSNTKKAYWTMFLNQKTPCLHGIENYSRAYNLPIVYCNIQRVKRGFYELELSWLLQNPSEYKEGQITALYMNKLEEIIKEKPGNWLWSHNRWKHKYENQKLVV